MKKVMKKGMGIVAVVTLFGAGLLFGLPINATIKAGDITGGKVAPHVNIAAFHAVHGKEGFKFPDHIADHNIIHALQGNAQYIFMNHTAGLVDGDVVTVANDVLRDNAGHFEDFGVDCQLSVHINASNQDVTLAGMCEFLMVDKDHRQIEHKGIVKPTVLQSGKDWVLIYYNAEDGIAVYADAEVGLE